MCAFETGTQQDAIIIFSCALGLKEEVHSRVCFHRPGYLKYRNLN